MSEIKTPSDAQTRPAARAALVDPQAPRTAEQSPLPGSVARRPAEQKSPAEWAYERISLYIQKFEEQLDADQEIGLGFAGADAGTLHIRGVGYFSPDIITFYGADDRGVKTQLIQHVSQLNVMLKAAPKIADKPARIGFDLAKGLEDEQA